MAGNNYNADYKAYEDGYILQEYPISWGIGYIILSGLFYTCGFSYQQFASFLLLTAIMIVSYVVVKYISEYQYIIIFYITFLMFLDSVQIRNFLMVALWTLAVSFLAERKAYHFLVVVIITILFHTSAVIMLPFIFLTLNSRISDRIIKIEVICIVVVCIVTFINGNKIPFIIEFAELILGKHMEDKMVYFFTKTNFGFLTSFLCQFVNIFLAKISNVFIQENAIRNKHEGYDWRRLSETIYKVVIVSNFALPLTMMNSNFARYFRMNNILIYIMIVMVIEIYHEGKKNAYVHRITLLSKYNVSMKVYAALVGVNLLTWIVLKQNFTSVADVFANNRFLFMSY